MIGLYLSAISFKIKYKKQYSICQADLPLFDILLLPLISSKAS